MDKQRAHVGCFENIFLVNYTAHPKKEEKKKMSSIFIGSLCENLETAGKDLGSSPEFARGSERP